MDPRIPWLGVLLVMGAACGDGGAATTATSDPPRVTTVGGGSSSGAPAVTTGGTGAPTDAGDGDGMGVSASDSTTGTSGDPPCPEGQVVCDGNVAKTCDGAGNFSEEVCDAACATNIGCTDCIPGTSKCDGMDVLVCTDDGAGYAPDETCDPLLGLTCDVQVGACVGACAALGSLSYIGCDYYAVTTQQYDLFFNDLNPFAIAIANAAGKVAMVTVTQGDTMITQVMVASDNVKLLTLPWVAGLVKGSGPSKHTKAGAYRVRSTQPVTVYQFSPVNADQSNDASLLLPVNAWSGHYLVAAWQHWKDYNLPGFYTVTASRDNTVVKLTGPPGGTPVQAGGGVDATGSGMALLNTGDVLTVVTAIDGDLTGSLVAADKPVQVIAGHECTQVPIGVIACDHLEESIFPLEVLANEYIVVPPVQVPDSAKEKAMFVRVVATTDDTQLKFTPEQPVDDVLVAAGDFVEIPSTVDKFKVEANHKILVAQYMVGQDGGYGTSDPSMLLAVPRIQYRDNYLIYAQSAWKANFVDIIALDGAAITVDGAPVVGFTAIPETGFSLAHVKLVNTGNGNHHLAGDVTFGISVYGVVDYGSYWYPGGLDLELIPPG